MILALSLASLLTAASGSLLSDPTDVRGVIRGAQATPLDPAGAASVDGPELSLRTRLTEPGSARQWGVFGVAPLGPLSLSAGYEWLEAPLQSPVDRHRATLGLGLDLGYGTAIGVAWRRLSRASGGDASTWDVSLLSTPASWLSLSLGVAQANEPRLGLETLTRTWWVGAGVRPILGAPWLTLGAEANLQSGLSGPLSAPRYLVDVAPLEGLHAQVAYQPTGHELWAGLSVALGGLETGLRVGADTRDASGTAQAAVSFTARGRPTESLHHFHGRTVEVALSGRLRAQGTFFSPAAPISEAAVALATLAEDPEVSRVVLSIGALSVSMAEIEELRGSIKKLRAAGKHVVAELAGGSEKEYLVAIAADEVLLDPTTSLVLDGYSVTLLYFGDALAKLGVRFDSVEIGRYKSAPDTLTRSEARPEEREITGAILRQLLSSLADAMIEDRKLAALVVDQILSRGLVTPADAMKLKLVDGFTQPTDPKKLPVIRASGEGLPEPAPGRRWGSPPVIAVVPVVGNISASGAAGALPGGVADANRLVRTLDELRRDGDVRAVVLRIDSPGGEVYASEVIWRAARLLANEKPLIVSMGGVAASGGYYVATPAQAILAEPSTITGSIGIFMLKPDLSGLLKLAGIHAETLQAGPRAAWSSPFAALTDQERALAREGLAVSYETFLSRVSEGRHLPLERVRQLAEGRVYTGEQALGVGLVDAIGGLADAITEAQLRAGLRLDAEVEVHLVREGGGLPSMLGLLDAEERSPINALYDSVRKVEALSREPMARLPFEVIVP
jgi:protease-4